MRRPNRWAVVAGLALIGVLFALPLRGLLRSQGPPMEEGFMLVFPEMILEGARPNRDFLHLYGPGGLWVLAGAFKAFGVSLLTERLVGLAQQVGVVLAIFALTRQWGTMVATVGAAVTLVIIVPPIGLTALAWVGALAWGLWSLRTGLKARQGAGRRMVLAGVLAGLALLYRPDLVLAVGLGFLPVWLGLERRLRLRLACGLALGVSPYLVHFATVGLGPALRGMVLDPVFYLRGGRTLPIPPDPNELAGFLQRAGAIEALEWPFPALSSPAQLTAWFFLLLAAVFLVAGTGAWGLRVDRTSVEARTLLAVGLFSLGLLPQAMQRPDSTHLAWVACVPLGCLPAAMAELLRRGVPSWSSVVRHSLAGGAAALLLVGLVPHFTARTYIDYVAQTFDRHRLSYEFSHAGRTFYYGRADVAAAVPALLEEVERVTQAGDRVVVGPSDLRKTPYSDAFLYYLLPDLVPATFYIEMDPGVANREGSRLADDIASADVVILSSVWEDWDEPNDSRLFGSALPGEVLDEHFCTVGTYGAGLYELLVRC